MELIKEQLQKVELYLDSKNITYIDLRMEVFDHIVSDIEAKMKDLDFETSFYNATKKWNKQLQDTSSFYFGIVYLAPKIVIEKAAKTYKKWFFLFFAFFLIPTILISKITAFLSDSLIINLNIFFQILSVISFISFIYLLVIKSKNKIKTTYSFILKTQSLNVIIGAIVLFDFNYINKNGTLDSFKTSILIAFIFSVYSYFHFYKKHKEAIKKYKIL